MSAPIEHGGGLSRAVARYGGTPDAWLDLSTGINPCPPPLAAIPPAAWHRLPDADLLRGAGRAAAAFYGTGGTLPLAVPGTQAAIQHLADLALPGRPVAILGPTYGEYLRVLSLGGYAVDAITELGGLRPEHGLAIVVNPNNPTGRLIPRDTLLAVADRMAGQGGRLLVDEAFGDMVPGSSVAADAVGHPGLVVFRSFGKFFGYAGLRLGFVMAEPALLDRLATRLGPWAVSGPALAVGQALLCGDTASIRIGIEARAAGLKRVLADARLTVIGGTPLFSLVEVADAQGLHVALCKEKILTRAFDHAPRWLRIGLAPDEAADERLSVALRRARS